MKSPRRKGEKFRRWDLVAVFAFGLIFLSVILVIAILFPNPTDWQIFVFRVALGMAAAGIGALVPGFITVNVHRYVRAGGALALFAIVFFMNPPALITFVPPSPAEVKQSDFRREEFQAYVKALAPDKQGSYLLRAAGMLLTAHRQGNLSYADDIIRFLSETDPFNGHALYYAGELKRYRRLRDQSHADFFRYLSFEKTLPERQRGGEAQACYTRPNGYCGERTGWICHLLANDFYEKGLKEGNEKKKRELFQTVREYVKCVQRKYRERGFDQHVATGEMVRRTEEYLK